MSGKRKRNISPSKTHTTSLIAASQLCMDTNNCPDIWAGPGAAAVLTLSTIGLCAARTAHTGKGSHHYKQESTALFCLNSGVTTKLSTTKLNNQTTI